MKYVDPNQLSLFSELFNDTYEELEQVEETMEKRI